MASPVIAPRGRGARGRGQRRGGFPGPTGAVSGVLNPARSYSLPQQYLNLLRSGRSISLTISSSGSQWQCWEQDGTEIKESPVQLLEKERKPAGGSSASKVAGLTPAQVKLKRFINRTELNQYFDQVRGFTTEQQFDQWVYAHCNVDEIRIYEMNGKSYRSFRASTAQKATAPIAAAGAGGSTTSFVPVTTGTTVATSSGTTASASAGAEAQSAGDSSPAQTAPTTSSSGNGETSN